ncbi:CpcT/CpeT family chromophore lyase [Thalassotalea piscium]
MVAIVTHESKAVTSERITDKLLLKFDQFVQGEFDNYNQVNFQHNDYLADADIPKKKHARLFVRITRINAPKLGQDVYYQEIHDGGKNKPVYRQSIQIVTPNYERNHLIAENYTFKLPEKFTHLAENENAKNLDLNDLKPVGENCHSEYRLVGDSFIGGIDRSQCKVSSKKFGYLNLSTQQVFTQDAFWHLEEGFLPSGKMLFGREDDIPHKLKRVKNFTCWAAFKNDKQTENGEPEWDFFKDITIHDQGGIAEFTTTGKVPKHYILRLKQTVFPAGNRPSVFEMFIHEKSEDLQLPETEALAYTWTNIGATRLGINLRWMQSSCSLN